MQEKRNRHRVCVCVLIAIQRSLDNAHFRSPSIPVQFHLTLFFEPAEFLNMFHDIFEALKSVIGSAMHLDGTKVKH